MSLVNIHILKYVKSATIILFQSFECVSIDSVRINKYYYKYLHLYVAGDESANSSFYE